jgi:hypothetical protein
MARYCGTDHLVITFTDCPDTQQPYCRNCHRRLFSPRDLRSANLPSADNSFSEVTKDSQSEVQNDKVWTKSKDDIESEGLDVNAQSSIATEGRIVAGSPVRVGPRRSFGGPRVECPRCAKAVYQAEQVREILCGASHAFDGLNMEFVPDAGRC